MKELKGILLGLSFMLVWYLALVFMTWELNPHNWIWFVRFTFTIFGLFFGILGYIFGSGIFEDK